MTPKSMDIRDCPNCGPITHASLVCVSCKNSLMPEWSPIPRDARDYGSERRVGEKPKPTRDTQRQQSARNSVKLTPKERAVAELLARGLTYSEAADALGINRGSISSLLFRASCRLGTNSAGEVVERVRRELQAAVVSGGVAG